MDDKLVRFFNKINFEYNEEDFKGVTVSKVIVKKISKSWDVYLSCECPLKIDVVEDLKEKCENGIDDIKYINIILEYKNISEEDIRNYFNYYIEKLIWQNPSLSSLEISTIKIEGNIISIEVTNNYEQEAIKNNEKSIEEFLERNKSRCS